MMDNTPGPLCASTLNEDFRRFACIRMTYKKQIFPLLCSNPTHHGLGKLLLFLFLPHTLQLHNDSPCPIRMWNNVRCSKPVIHHYEWSSIVSRRGGGKLPSEPLSD